MTQMHGNTPKETPTDFLVRCLEEIEGAEDVVVIFRKVKDGVVDIDWKANDVPRWKLFGMLELAKFSMYEPTEEEEDATD